MKKAAKRGRPKLAVRNARERAIFVRASEDEYARFEEAAKQLGLPVATWLRSLAIQACAK